VLRRTVLAAPVAALLAASGCRAAAPENLRIVVPNAPGSGYDITARAVATALDSAGVARGVEVFNLPGAGGMVGLRRLVYERGNGALLLLMGLGLVGAQHASSTSVTLDDVTPVARLMEEPEVVVVTHDSPLRTLADLVAAWTANPAGVGVGGGSTPGGPDHLAPMLMASAVGIAPRRVRYVRFDGGGALLAAILAKHVTFAVSSLGEYAEQVGSGQLRVLAVTSLDRAPGLDAPTLREAGLDLVFANWRGLVAPPGLSDADESRLLDLVARLHSSGIWREAIARHRWTDTYLAGPAFGRVIRAEDARLARILAELGL
jgi:putative tricarboxylic transport membrane protein